MTQQEGTGLAMPVRDLLALRRALTAGSLLADIVGRGVQPGSRDARFYQRQEAKIKAGLALLDRLGVTEPARPELERVERLGAGVTRLHSPLGFVDVRAGAVQGTTIQSEAARAAVLAEFHSRQQRKEVK